MRRVVKKPTRRVGRCHRQAAADGPADRVEIREDLVDLPKMRQCLLRWYRKVRRPLPWRLSSKHGAYGIWVSEAMSQQTRMSSVVPYWHRWMSRFPNIKSLASASAEAVRKEWAGLGYYRRAALLHAGAIHVVTHCGGRLPQTAAELEQLPGIGPYTAAAIASISFRQRVAVVDGNIMRVVLRLRGLLNSNVHDADTVAKVRCDAQWMIASCRAAPGDWNQALMELGATVCVPSGPPRCAECPLAQYCGARKALLDGRIAEICGTIPLRCEQKARHVVYVACVAVTRNGDDGDDRAMKVLLVQRPPSGPLASMFELPCVESTSLPSSKSRTAERTVLSRKLSAILLNSRVSPSNLTHIGNTKHILSHVEYVISAYHWRTSNHLAVDGNGGDCGLVQWGHFRISSSGRQQQLHRSSSCGLPLAGTVRKVLPLIPAVGGDEKKRKRKRDEADNSN